jgi:hypothetical protein
LQGKEVEVQKGRLSPSYQKELRRFVNFFKIILERPTSGMLRPRQFMHFINLLTAPPRR